MNKTLLLYFLFVPPRPRHHGNQSCVTASDIMQEVDASAPDQRQEVGAVMGRVLYHTLKGRCFPGGPLPEESFFLDSILTQLSSENFTVDGKCPSQAQRDINAHRDRPAGRFITW